MANPFIEQHQDKITGALSCYDRVVITGTLPEICHPSAMGGYLSYHKIRLFDYARWAEPLREEIRVNAERIAAAAGLQIEFIRKSKAFRKEDSGPTDPCRTRRPSRLGPCLFRHGDLCILPALA